MSIRNLTFKAAALAVALSTASAFAPAGIPFLGADQAMAGHRHHGHHGRRHYRRHHRGGGVAAGVAGAIIGLGVGAALANQPRRAPRRVYGHPRPWTPEWYDYCSARYRSFDSRSGTFQPYHGPRRLCR